MQKYKSQSMLFHARFVPKGTNPKEGVVFKVEQEKRKFGEYTELSSFRIGKYEIGLFENQKAPKDEQFLCGFIESNGIMERLIDGMVSDSYADIATVYGERIAEKAEEVQKELEHIGKNVGDDSELTAKDCLPTTYKDDLEGKIIVVRGDILRPEYKRASNQLLLCTGGSGSKPNPYGRSCYAVYLYDARETVYYRQDILGVMPEDKLPEWAKKGLEAIRQKSTEIHKKKDERGER